MPSKVTPEDVAAVAAEAPADAVYELDTSSSTAVEQVAAGRLPEWQAAALAALRVPFPDSEVGKLPKSGCKDCKQFTPCGQRGHVMVRKCPECKQDHPSSTFHVDYVGHAALTNRLLSVDPLWDWEPLSYNADGTPLIKNGEMWIKLTVAGMTRKGVGEGRSSKILIGNALRNAGMRFGMALDLWWKGEFDDFDEDEAAAPVLGAQAASQPPVDTGQPAFDPDVVATFVMALGNAASRAEVTAIWNEAKAAGVLDAPIEWVGKTGPLRGALTYQGNVFKQEEDRQAATMALPGGEAAADMVQAERDAEAQGAEEAAGYTGVGTEPPF